MRYSRHTKILAFDFVINTFLTIVELVAGALTGSAAILADGSQNLTDSLVLSVAYVCERIAGRPKTSNAAAKQLYRWASCINASILMALAVLIAVLAIHRALYPQILNTLTVIGIGVLSIIINFWAAGMLFAARRDATVTAPYVGLLYSGLSGIGVFASGLLAHAFGFYRADGIVGIAIAALLFIRSSRMLAKAIRRPAKLFR